MSPSPRQRALLQSAGTKPGAHPTVKFGLPPWVGLHGAPRIRPDLPREEEARAPQRLCALSALPAPLGGAPRVAHSHREPPPPELRRASSRLCFPSSTAASRPLPSAGPAPPLPHPGPRPRGPGSQGPACAPGALMSSTDSLRWLTWCLLRISRQDLSSGGSISPAHLVHPGAAPREGAERGRRR